MEKDIVLFFFYSSPPIPQGCFLDVRDDIAYRNMFLSPCGDNKIHFEFPMFEDHSYNTICNRKGLRSLIKRPRTNDKYIIFRTRDEETGDCIIIGYYRIRKKYYQETRMFNNNGFVWGIESEPYLIRKGLIKCTGLGLRRGHRNSWRRNEWSERLNVFINNINEEENVSDVYQAETNRLIDLFKDRTRVTKWRQYCLRCEDKIQCRSPPQISKLRERPSRIKYVFRSKLHL